MLCVEEEEEEGWLVIKEGGAYMQKKKKKRNQRKGNWRHWSGKGTMAFLTNDNRELKTGSYNIHPQGGARDKHIKSPMNRGRAELRWVINDDDNDHDDDY